MQVQIRLFAALRERAGTERLALELPAGARVADALAELDWLTRGLLVVMAVNRGYAEPGVVLHAGDELALIPPVSGGDDRDASSGTAPAADGTAPAAHGAAPAADGTAPAAHGAAPHVRVHEQPLSAEALIERVTDPRAGAVVTFLGMTRQQPFLDYEAYVEMAHASIAAIAAEAIERHRLCAAAVEHRIGRVALSEASIVVAASAPHRAEAFAGAREILDRVKAQAPIWKKEAGEWVAGAVPGAPGTAAAPRAGTAARGQATTVRPPPGRPHR